MNSYGVKTGLLWNLLGGDAGLFDGGLHFRAVDYLCLGENNQITLEQ